MKIYLTTPDKVHAVLDEVLRGILGDYETEKNQFGKPYVRGNDIFFNISHSGNYAAAAVSDKPVGIDIEVIKGRGHQALLKKFSEAERSEIKGEADFLKHFTAREAYVKYKGVSLFPLLKRLAFIGGDIFLDGERQAEKIKTFTFGGFILSVCGEGEIQFIDTQSG